MTRDDQFRIIDSAKRQILAWAKGAAMPLHAVEFVVPFGDTDFGLSVWFFYETKDQLNRANSDKSSERLRAAFIERLVSLGYDSRWLPEVVFVFDSH